MRIIAGLAKNRKLKAPPGQDTRPITDMIKEALFNVLANQVSEAVFLDLFAGSGSVGIEALSRGAKQVVFIDSSFNAIKVIKNNLEHCRLTTGAEVYKNDVFKALDILHKKNASFDIIYIDPPFTNPDIFDEVMLYLDDKPELLDSEGIIIMRTQSKRNLPEQYTNLIKKRKNEYGESVLHYYSKP